MFEQDDSSRRQKVNVLSYEPTLFKRFHFRAKRKSIGSPKNDTRYFQISLWGHSMSSGLKLDMTHLRFQ